MKYVQLFISFIFISVIFISCDEEVTIHDNQTSGQIKISIDESYKLVMEQQVKVFQSNFPKAKIIAEYKSEDDCLKDFFEDTTRVIFISRDLTKEEKEYATTKNIAPKSMTLARDAVAFVVSKNSTDTLLTITQLKQILEGTNTQKKLKLVFENKNSACIRYVQDSILRGAKMHTDVFAANGIDDLVKYVNENEKAIGIIGVNWVSDVKDSTSISFLSKIRLAGILPSNNDSVKFYVRPFQAYIGLKEYPCTRELHFITKETWMGLGTGFINFLSHEGGQILFKNTGLFPLRVNVLLRQTEIKTH